jgi:hypothetical protein
MVPTEFMETAVAMITNALPQLSYFDDKFLTCHPVKIPVHKVLPY